MESLAGLLVTMGSSMIDIMVDVSFYLLVGLILAGLARALVPANFILKHVGQPTTTSVVKASIIGVPMPLCSCSVVPMAVSLREQGASKGATASFLISAPETGIDSLAVSYAMLDPLMTIFRPVAAFATALLAGIAENFDGKNPAASIVEIKNESCDCCDDLSKPTPTERVPLVKKIKDGLSYAFGDLLRDISYYLIIGLAISAILAALVPSDFFMTSNFSNFTMMLLMLVVGIPVYVCASASTPIAATLILKGLSPGAALVFLLAGPATNLSSIGIVKKLLGRRSMWIYLMAIAVTALILGFLLDLIYGFFSLPISMNLGTASEIIPHEAKLISAAIFLPLLAWGFVKEVMHRLRSGH